MEKIIVCGGKPLRGSVRVQGAKNAALPILAACVLLSGVTKSDVKGAVALVKHTAR